MIHNDFLPGAGVQLSGGAYLPNIPDDLGATLSSEKERRAGEWDQWLKALVALPEDLSSVPRAKWWLTIISDSNSRESEALFWLPQAPGMHTVHRQHS